MAAKEQVNWAENQMDTMEIGDQSKEKDWELPSRRGHGKRMFEEDGRGHLANENRISFFLFLELSIQFSDFCSIHSPLTLEEVIEAIQKHKGNENLRSNGIRMDGWVDES